MLKADFEVSEVVVSETLRRTSLRWAKKGKKPKWLTSSQVLQRTAQLDRRFASLMGDAQDRNRAGRGLGSNILVPIGEIIFEGMSGLGGFRSGREIYLKAGEAIALYLASLPRTEESVEDMRALSVCFFLMDQFNSYRLTWSDATVDLLESMMERGQWSILSTHIPGLSDFVSALKSSPHIIFDPYAWDRRES